MSERLKRERGHVIDPPTMSRRSTGGRKGHKGTGFQKLSSKQAGYVSVRYGDPALIGHEIPKI